MLALSEIGKEAAAERRKQKLTQRELASRCGVSRATIDLLENGRATDIGYSKLARILGALGLELRLGPATSRRPTLDDLMKERESDD
jgi:transcriptional regulator with XRE-family HTH domain